MRLIKVTELPDGEVETLEIVNAEYVDDFRIHLQFSDGVEKTVNFGHFLERARHPTLKKYRDVTQFRSFRLVFGNLDWNDYEMCFPVADLYEGNV